MSNTNVLKQSASLKEEIENLLLRFTKILSRDSSKFSSSIFSSGKNSKITKTINKLEIIEGELQGKIFNLNKLIEMQSEDLISVSISDYYFFKNYLEYAKKMKEAISEYLALEKNLAKGLIYSFLHSKVLGASYRQVLIILNEASQLKKSLVAEENSTNN